MGPDEVDAYLGRLGVRRAELGGPGPLGAGGLAALQLAHLRAVPFEDLSVHLGEAITLEPSALVDKVVRRRRGGYCYALNGAAAELLRALGHHVDLLAARVAGDGGRWGPPYDHMALRVLADGAAWLVDVGFGAFTDHPVLLDERVPQADPAGVVLVTDAGPDQVDVLLGGRPQYRLDLRPAALADFVPTCWWQATSPDSHFTGWLTCSRRTERGRITLTGTRLITTEGDARHEELLAGDAEVLDAYRRHFGITLERVPPEPQARAR